MAQIQIPLIVADGETEERANYVAHAMAHFFDQDIRNQNIICDLDEMGPFKIYSKENVVIFETETDKDRGAIVEALMIILAGLLFKASYKDSISFTLGKWVREGKIA